MKTWIIINKENLKIMGFYLSEEKKNKISDDITNDTSDLEEPVCVHVELLENLEPTCINVEFIDGEYIFSADNEKIALHNAMLQNVGTGYMASRRREYPPIEEQLDMIYWDKINGTNDWQELIGSIKTKYPKN